MKKLFNLTNKSTKFKMIIIYLFVSIIPIITVQMISVKLYSNDVEIKINQVLDSNLVQISQNVEGKMDSLKNIMYSIHVDEQFLKELKNFDMEQIVQNAIVANHMVSVFTKYVYNEHSILNITLVNNYGRNISYNGRNNKIEGDLDQLFVERLFGNIGGNISVTDTLINTYFAPSNNNRIFYMVMPIKDIETGVKKGAMAMGVDARLLSDIWNIRSASTEFKIRYYMTNQEDVVQFAENAEDIGSKLNDCLDDPSEYVLQSRAVEDTPWKIYAIVKRDEMLKEIYSSTFKSILITLLCFILSIGIIIIFTNSFTATINNLVMAMKNVQKGEFSVEIKANTKNELLIVETSFNKMVKKIEALINEIKAKQDENIYLIEKQKIAELKALEAQINPHYIYNTLNCINWMAIDKGELEISQALKCLAQIMRYSISRISEEVPLEREMEWLENYLFLQKIRMVDKFDYQLVVEEDTVDFPIHKLLMQPIIENALIHGFENVEIGGQITVEAKLDEHKRLVISITDNGKGMTEEILKGLTENMKSLEEEEKHQSIGMKNVYQRIKSYYGEESDLVIQSEIKKGTTIQLIIPRIL